MYQAGRHGTAIGFLKHACSLGVKALDMWKKEPRLEDKAKGRREKTEEGWRQLEEQLYRRWELLGVCYSKIGDRKVGVSFYPDTLCASLWLLRSLASL